MSEKREIKLFIQDVFDCIEKINVYVSGMKSEKGLKDNKQAYDAVMMNFIIIGEAVKNIYEEVRENHPNVKWQQIMAMRNLIVHEYWGVNEGVIWEAIEDDLPELKVIVAKIKNSLS